MIALKVIGTGKISKIKLRERPVKVQVKPKPPPNSMLEIGKRVFG